MNGLTISATAFIDGGAGAFVKKSGFKSIQRLAVGDYLLTADREFDNDEWYASCQVVGGQHIIDVTQFDPGVLSIKMYTVGGVPVDGFFMIMMVLDLKIRT